MVSSGTIEVAVIEAVSIDSVLTFSSEQLISELAVMHLLNAPPFQPDSDIVLGLGAKATEI